MRPFWSTRGTWPNWPTPWRRRWPAGPRSRSAAGASQRARGYTWEVCAERHVDTYRWAAGTRNGAGAGPGQRTGKVRRVRALVTGANGFVGTWLTGHLADQGDEVVGIDHEVNVTDAGAVRRCCSWPWPRRPSTTWRRWPMWATPGGIRAVLQVNAVGTLNLGGGPGLCQAAGAADQFGRGLRGGGRSLLPVSESTPLAPVTPYVASKVAAEYLGVQAHLAYGLPVVRVGPFNHIGPGQSAGFVVSALAARIAEAARDGASTIPVGNLEARRDLTDVRDIVRAYRLLMASGEPGEVYNVCSGRDVAISEVAERLLRLAGAELTLMADAELMRPVDVPVVRGDPSKLRAATGWEPGVRSRHDSATTSSINGGNVWSETAEPPAGGMAGIR